jgi:hypothetical protein
MKYVKCPKCGTENVANRILCVKCAENLSRAATYERFDIGELFSGIRPSLAAAASPSGSLTSEIIEKARLWDEHFKIAQVNRIKTGANCFFCIAGVSAIETIIFWTGKRINFFDSLGITQVIDLFSKGLMQQMPKLVIIPQIGAFVLDIIFALAFVGFGFYAHKGHRLVYIIGMALYALDMLIVIRFVDILSVAFHLAALYVLYRGLKASIDKQKGEMATV